jgi:hypothetical protein
MEPPIPAALQFLPELEPIPWRLTEDLTTTDTEADDWDSEPDVVDPIPPIHFRPYDPATDGHLFQTTTSPPMDDTTTTTFTTLTTVEEFPEDDALTPPSIEDADLLTPISPPKPPVDQELPCRPSNPTDPPTTLSSGNTTFVKFKQHFFNLLKLKKTAVIIFLPIFKMDIL